jgi:hypothetical protein
LLLLLLLPPNILLQRKVTMTVMAITMTIK